MLTEEYITQHTPFRGNMKINKPKKFVQKLNNIRRLIETAIGQLTERFNIENVWAGDLWYLTVRRGKCLLIRLIAISTARWITLSCNLKTDCRENLHMV